MFRRLKTLPTGKDYLNSTQLHINGKQTNCPLSPPSPSSATAGKENIIKATAATRIILVNDLMTDLQFI
jgi:hypothetical protein